MSVLQLIAHKNDCFTVIYCTFKIFPFVKHSRNTRQNLAPKPYVFLKVQVIENSRLKVVKFPQWEMQKHTEDMFLTKSETACMYAQCSYLLQTGKTVFYCNNQPELDLPTGLLLGIPQGKFGGACETTHWKIFQVFKLYRDVHKGCIPGVSQCCACKAALRLVHCHHF